MKTKEKEQLTKWIAELLEETDDIELVHLIFLILAKNRTK